MYVARVPNRGSPPAVLLRESYREGGKVRNRTLANLSRWPEDKVDALAAVLKGLPPKAELADAFEISRSLPHGHVAAVLGTLSELGLEGLIDPAASRSRDLVVAMVVSQVISPTSKAAVARGLRGETATSSLGEVLSVSGADEDNLYDAMDWLTERQEAIEDRLAARHLTNPTLVLYDVSSAAFEGRTCPLGAIGHARDGVRGRLQIVYGVLTTTEGIPVAIEVFEGNTGDPATLGAQVAKLKDRFRLERIAVVGDRGMVTPARIRDDLSPAGLDWVSALRAPQIKALMRQGAIQLSLFEHVDVAEISHPDYPDERLVCCYNPDLAAERARKRSELVSATETQLDKIASTVAAGRLRDPAKIGVRVGRVLNRYKVAKHFDYHIAEGHFAYARKDEAIAAEASLDGIYVLRTSLPPAALDAPGVVSTYKALENVERVFRFFNSELDIRPIRHRLEDRVRAHVFLRMLSYYVAWHMTRSLAPILFVDHDPAAARAAQGSPVAPARRSSSALAKAATKRTEDGEAVHSFETLLDDLATVCVNRIRPNDPDVPAFDIITTPTTIQERAFQLLEVNHRLGYT